jgi:hypothetical protein
MFMTNTTPKWVPLMRLGLLLLGLLAAGCGPAEITVTREDVSPTLAYPAPTQLPPPESAYPVSGADANKPVLVLDKPIQANDTVVTGIGPPNLIVELVNITFMGTTLGTGVVDNDGTFAITVDPLPRGIRLGLAADVEAMELTPEEFRSTDGTISIPQVGHFFDSVVIP